MPKSSRYFIVYALMFAVGLFIHLHADEAVPMNRPFDEFPHKVGSWQMTDTATFSPAVLKVLRPTDYLYRDYVDSLDGSRVQLYIGYHSGGKGAGGIHSPKHCLPGSGWYEVIAGKLPLELSGGTEPVMRAVYQKGHDKTLFLYWFQMKGQMLTNEYALKVGEIVNSIRYGRRDEAFIRISVPDVIDQRQAEEIARRFARDFKPVIDAFLPS